MIDLNDNAKSAVREFAGYIGQSDKCERYLEHVATKKTVADAPPYPHFKATRENLEKIAKDAQGDFVEVEQEGEKWTHEYGSANIKCRILATDEGECWVLTEYGNKVTESIDSLKPIKLTMTKVEREAVARFITRIWSKRNPNLRAEFDAFCDEHDII